MKNMKNHERRDMVTGTEISKEELGFRAVTHKDIVMLTGMVAVRVARGTLDRVAALVRGG